MENKHHPIYISRTAEMQEVRRFINNVGAYCILNLHSVQGLGKSTFLKLINDQFKLEMPTVLVRVTDSIYWSADFGGGFRIDLFLAKIVKKLQGDLSLDKTSQSSTNVDIVNVSALSHELTTLVQQACHNGTPPLLLIDDYDHLNFGSRIVFEDLVLSKIVEPPNQAAVVLSSEQELVFPDRFDLSVRCKSFALMPVDKNEIVQLVPQYANLASEILRRTGGVPDLIDFVIDRVRKKSITSLDEYKEREEELFDLEFRNQLRSVAFPDIHQLSDEAIDVLAMLRRFDVSILNAILPKVYPQLFAAFKQKNYLDLIRELGSRVYWRDQGGYALNPILRTALFSYIAQFEQPIFKLVNQTAVESYQDWLTDEYREYYLLEMLYHRLTLQKSRKQDESAIRDLISTSLLDFIENKRKPGLRDFDGLDSLEHALRADEDLMPFLNREVFEMIERKLQQKN